MRVLILTHRLPYAPNRGDRIRAFHLVHQIAARADVDLISLTHDAEESAHAQDLRHVVSRIAVAPVPRLSNMARALVALPTSQPLTHSLLHSPEMPAAIDAMIATAPPDVILAYCSGVARYALEPPLCGIPAIVDMVDVDSEKWGELAAVSAPPRRWIYRRERRVLARFEAAAARHARTTLVVNERERASLLRIAPEADVRVVENGIDLAAFRPGHDPAGDATVVFCGVMNYAPNEQGARWLAGQVWPIVRRRRPDARLCLVGSQPTPAVRALAAQDRSIEVTGTVPDVRPFLQRAAVAAAPLQTARGIQNKVLEAIASGLPTVVTPVVFGGLPAIAAPACRVAAAPDTFADAIVDLLNRTAAERRAVAARADLSALAWSRQLAPVLKILDEAAAGVARRL